MTERRYYSDSYTRTFTARVRERLTVGDRPALVLDRTYFYPTSGGQPNDLGSLNGIPVQDVIVREADQAILHILGQPVDAGAVECEIDWARRFDHMQQHTGQHILSQAFIRVAEATTLGFHLGTEAATIDVEGDKLAPAWIDQAERIANQAVIADHPVRAWFPTLEELSRIVLRKTPDVEGPLRVVAIGDYDLTACGGTHVARTGEVGLIKITRVETQKKGTRVEFICGGRALGDYGRKHDIVGKLTGDFTCGQSQVIEAVARLRDENQALRKELRAVREAVLDYEAKAMREGAAARNGMTVVRGAWPDRDLADLRGLATRLAASPGVVALLASSGAKANFVFARAGDVGRDMNGLLKSTLSLLDHAKGGGSPAIAQGGGLNASLQEVQKALEHAESELWN